MSARAFPFVGLRGQNHISAGRLFRTLGRSAGGDLVALNETGASAAPVRCHGGLRLRVSQPTDRPTSQPNRRGGPVSRIRTTPSRMIAQTIIG